MVVQQSKENYFKYDPHKYGERKTTIIKEEISPIKAKMKV